MAELGGKSFFNSCKNWREGDILVSLKKHAVDMYGKSRRRGGIGSF